MHHSIHVKNKKEEEKVKNTRYKQIPNFKTQDIDNRLCMFSFRCCAQCLEGASADNSFPGQDLLNHAG